MIFSISWLSRSVETQAESHVYIPVQSSHLCQQVATQVLLVVDDDGEVVDEAFSQFDVNLSRRRRYGEHQLVVREDALTFQTAIVFNARPTPRQLATTCT